MDLFALKFDGLEIKEPNETFQDIYCAKLIVVVHAVRHSRELPQLLSWNKDQLSLTNPRNALHHGKR